VKKISDINNKEIIQKGRNKKRMDWRIELARIPSIIVVVIVHMQLDSEWINGTTMPQNFLLYIAMGVFMFASGFVQGLKNEFNSPGTITKNSYLKYIKKRALRLYIGYYLALGAVFLSRIIAYYVISKPFPYVPTPWTIFLDLTGTWGLFSIGGCGGIWPPGWFICAIFLISLLYPFLRRLNSNNKKYLLLIIGITITIRIIVALTLYNPAYFFPYSWISEFTIGMMIGDWSRRTGGPPIITKNYQKTIIKLGARVWPMYLCHIVPIVWISYLAGIWEFVIIFTIILPLTEVYRRLLNFINRKIKKLY